MTDDRAEEDEGASKRTRRERPHETRRFEKRGHRLDMDTPTTAGAAGPATPGRTSAAQDVVPPADSWRRACESRPTRIVNRSPESFSHSGAAVRRRAGTVQPNSSEPRPLPGAAAVLSSPPTRNGVRFGWDGGAQTNTPPPTGPANRTDDPRQTLRSLERSSIVPPISVDSSLATFRGPREKRRWRTG